MARGFCPSGIFLKYDNNVSSLRNYFWNMIQCFFSQEYFWNMIMFLLSGIFLEYDNNVSSLRNISGK
jgi:hypothetical protein